MAIFLPAPPIPEPNPYIQVALFVALSLILLLSYGLMRWILRPLQALTEGVSRITAGDFGYRVVCARRDELGRLAAAFNQMTIKLKAAIESKKQLLIDVSHELRSPLARARVALEFIPDANTRKEVTEEVDEMTQMVDSLLEGAQLESGTAPLRLERTNLSTLAKEMVERYQTFGNVITLRSETSRDPVISIDVDRIRAVVRNLIENAIKYSPEKSLVTVNVSESANTLSLTVQDQGIGISEAELPHIFEPFYRVDKSRTRATGGFGLGLSLCKKIVEAHGGKIEIESAEGKGTLVTMELPKNVK